MFDEQFRQRVNLSFLVAKICKEVFYLRGINFNFKFKNNPEEIFSRFAEIDEKFKENYFNIFSKVWDETFLFEAEKERQKSIINYSEFYKLAKNFAREYLGFEPKLQKEMEDISFGLVEPYSVVNYCENLETFLKIVRLADIEAKNHFILIPENYTNENEEEIYLDIPLNPPNPTSNTFKISQSRQIFRKFPKIKGITIELKTHRIKNNRTKRHYNFDESELNDYLQEFAWAILNHEIPPNQENCKTFEIFWKNNKVCIKPGSKFKKTKNK